MKGEREGERGSEQGGAKRDERKGEAEGCCFFSVSFSLPPAQREANPEPAQEPHPECPRREKRGWGRGAAEPTRARTALLGCSRPRGQPRASARGRGRPTRCADGTCPVPALPCHQPSADGTRTPHGSASAGGPEPPQSPGHGQNRVALLPGHTSTRTESTSGGRAAGARCAERTHVSSHNYTFLQKK